jgi:hypothetical protein
MELAERNWIRLARVNRNDSQLIGMLLNCLCHRICRVVLATNPSNPKEFLMLYEDLHEDLHKDLHKDLHEDLHKDLHENLHGDLHQDLHEDLYKDLHDCFIVDIDRTLCRILIPR